MARDERSVPNDQAVLELVSENYRRQVPISGADPRLIGSVWLPVPGDRGRRLESQQFQSSGTIGSMRIGKRYLQIDQLRISSRYDTRRQYF